MAFWESANPRTKIRCRSPAPRLEALGPDAARGQVRGLVAEFQARQLNAPPWKEIPVIHRDDDRGHGRHEQRLVQVVTVNGLLFPHAAQVLRIRRRCRLYGAKKWSRETVYAITDLPAEEASVAEIASWARGHWAVENTVHWCRDVTFNEGKSQVRAHNTPSLLAVLRDLIRGTLKLAGYVNTAAGRRANTERTLVLSLYGIT